MKHVYRPIALFLFALGMAHPSDAQPADSVVTRADGLATFDEARALAIDPAGKLYVVDAGIDAVVQLDATGKVLATIGGPGTEDGQFDNPMDVDPTNGLLWVVADAGNNRLQRFTRDFLHLESLAVSRISRFTPGVTHRTVPIGKDRAVNEADGRPIAVAVSNANEIYAVDDTRRLVLKWDAGRRLVGVIGGFDAGEGALVEPVALAVDATSLYVADPGQQAVLVYDLFGAYVRTLAGGRATQVSGLTVYRDELWIVLPERVLVYHTRGRLLHVYDIRLGEPLLDVAVRDGTVYLLTARRLWRTVL